MRKNMSIRAFDEFLDNNLKNIKKIKTKDYVYIGQVSEDNLCNGYGIYRDTKQIIVSEWVEGIHLGFSIFIEISGDIHIGHCNEKGFCGLGIEFDINTDLITIGKFKENDKNGNIIEYRYGQLFVGTYNKGLKNGEFYNVILRNENNKPKFSQDFSIENSIIGTVYKTKYKEDELIKIKDISSEAFSGKKDDYIKVDKTDKYIKVYNIHEKIKEYSFLVSENENKYFGQIKGYYPNGKGIMLYPNKKIILGNFIDGKPNGGILEIIIDNKNVTNSTIIYSKYKNGIKNGNQITYNKFFNKLSLKKYGIENKYAKRVKLNIEKVKI